MGRGEEKELYGLVDRCLVLANMLFSLTSIELWGQETVPIPASGESLLVNIRAGGGGLFKVLQAVHREGGIAAQIELDRLLF